MPATTDRVCCHLLVDTTGAHQVAGTAGSYGRAAPLARSPTAMSEQGLRPQGEAARQHADARPSQALSADASPPVTILRATNTLGPALELHRATSRAVRAHAFEAGRIVSADSASGRRARPARGPSAAPAVQKSSDRPGQRPSCVGTTTSDRPAAFVGEASAQWAGRPTHQAIGPAQTRSSGSDGQRIPVRAASTTNARVGAVPLARNG